jgi:hypothetical protein
MTNRTQLKSVFAGFSLQAFPLAPFQGAVVFGRPQGVCLLRPVAVFSHPYSVKCDWQAHQVRYEESLGGLQDAGAVPVAMMAMNRRTALAAAVVPSGDSAPAQLQAHASNALNVRVSGEPAV